MGRRSKGKRKQRGITRRRPPGVGFQKGGIVPLLALAFPALAAVGKAAALGSLGGAASYGVKKGLEAATRRCRR